MYTMPGLYGFQDCLKPVSQQQIEACKDEVTGDRKGCARNLKVPNFISGTTRRQEDTSAADPAAVPAIGATADATVGATGWRAAGIH